MDELRRLQYLDAIGVQQYVARQTLALALPSTHVDIVFDVDVPAGSGAGRAGVIAADIPPVRKPAPVSPQQTLTPQPGPGRGPVTGNAVRFQLALFIVDNILVMDGSGQQTNQHLRLLANILKALGLDSGSIEPETRFSWPPRPGLDASPKAGADTLGGIVDGILARHQIQDILVLDFQCAGLLLQHNEITGGLHPAAYAGHRIWVTFSLQDILSDPAKKRVVWQHICQLMRKPGNHGN